MSLALTMPKNRNSVVDRAKAERRHFVRVRLDLAGRFFLPSDNREAECKIVDLSPGGAQISSEIVPSDDAPIILYVDGFGRLEGNVARPTEGGFSVNFHCSAAKRDKIAEQLTLYMNRDVVDESTMRRHDRAPNKGLASFTRANGEIVSCEVLDLSLSGVSLKTLARPPIGETVLIGHSAGRVVRHHENGVAIEFVGSQHEKPQADQPTNPFLVVR